VGGAIGAFSSQTGALYKSGFSRKLFTGLLDLLAIFEKS
jgi:hypothetical protein